MSKSSFERIVGNVPDVEKERIMQTMEDRFDDQEFKDLIDKEREKTSEELQIINLANQVTNELLKRYGLDNFDIPPQNIHIIKEDEWPRDEKGSAVYISSFQGIATREQDSNIVFLKKAIHEMLHFKSYNAAQVTKSENPEVAEYRVGLVVHTRDGQTMYFKNLNEATTEEITKELIRKLPSENLIKEEIHQTQDLSSRYSDAVTASGQPLFGDDVCYAKLSDKTTVKDKIGRVFGVERSRKIYVDQFSYGKERLILHKLSAKLFKGNPQFHTEEEVIEFFKKCMITGNILPLGRLIDGTFGKGTLRKIGELDSDVEAQEKFVDSL
jgi:hypothetical protein